MTFYSSESVPNLAGRLSPTKTRLFIDDVTVIAVLFIASPQRMKSHSHGSTARALVARQEDEP